jgi:hypothetical protein
MYSTINVPNPAPAPVVGWPWYEKVAWVGSLALVLVGIGGVFVAVGSLSKLERQPYDISRGTIRFPLSEPVPVSLIERIAEFRGKEVARRRKITGTM